MRRLLGLAAVLALLAPLALSSDDATGQGQQERDARGTFSLLMMVHTQSSSFGDLPNVKAWDGRFRTGRFAYRSIPCSGNAPVINISSDLPTYNGRVRGSRVPASLRAHPFSFRVQRTRSRGREMVGTMTLTVCKLGPGPTPTPDPVPDEEKPRIRVTFRARYERMNAETLRYAGTFRIRGGTQRYEDLTGSGEIGGYLFCFNPRGCRALGGEYLDGQMSLQGRYRDPTPQLRR